MHGEYVTVACKPFWSSSFTGEPNVVPKFTQIASSCRLRPCLYAWLGSLPRSSSGSNRLSWSAALLLVVSAPAHSIQGSDDSTLALP